MRANVEFSFSRYYHPGAAGHSSPLSSLPAWADLRPIDPANNWVLAVRLFVAEDNQPEKMKKANEELMAVKTELEKLFDFQAIDRRVFDTRIVPPPAVPGRPG